MAQELSLGSGERPDPLAGTVVLDLTQVVSGAVTTMLLAEFGAEVIKVEPPGGEAYRRAGYPIVNERGATNLNILRFSRGKKSVTLDLKTAAGTAILRRLVERADVLVENFRPGVLARLGFPPEELECLNERLVYATVSGYGHDDLFPGPYRDRPAYAIAVEAMAGLTHLAGHGEGPPVWMGFAMADIFSGTLAFAGVLLALRDPERHRRVDISMYDGAVFMNDLAAASMSVVGELMGPGKYALQAPWGPFPTTDGHVVVAVLNEHEWKALCGVIGRADLAADPGLASGRDRSRELERRVAPAIAEWTRARTKDVCADELLRAGVPAAPVNTAADLLDCPQLHGREMLPLVEDAVAGPVRLVGNPIKVAGHAAARERRIPQLGEHTDEALRALLELDDDDLARARREGAFG